MKHFILAIGMFFPVLTGLCVTPITPDSTREKDVQDSTIHLIDQAYAAELDSTIYCFYESLIGLSTDAYAGAFDASLGEIPSFTSEDYRTRLSGLDVQSPFDLSYNSAVDGFIKLYVERKRGLSARCLGRADLYFPLIEETLDRYGLPLELKYLAVVESGLIPTAKSKAGATGMWQFMYGTGKVFGLQINSYVDERCDVALSTDAACRYLRHLYDMFGDWNLALAAYNCGEGRVTRAIRKSGGKTNYWELYPYLPKETRGYVPAFIAVNYVFAYANEHGIAPEPALFNAYEVDTIHVNQALTFSQVAELLRVEEAVIADLNPIYRLQTVPAYGTYNVLRLPKDACNRWVSNEETVAEALKKMELVKPSPSEPAPAPVEPTTYYTVRSGDYLGKIASRYGCTVSQIQRWNNMSGTTLRVGQKLIIHSSSTPVNDATTSVQPTAAVNSSNSSTPSGSSNVYYSIKPGDTLWDIAKARGVSLDDLKRWNSHVNFNHLKPGQKIIVGKA